MNDIYTENQPDEEIEDENMTDEEISAILASAILSYRTPIDILEETLDLRRVTTDELALVLGITTTRISQLWKEGIIEEPQIEGKRYYFSLLNCVNQYLCYLRNL